MKATPGRVSKRRRSAGWTGRGRTRRTDKLALGRNLAVGVDKLAVDAHRINLLQRHRVTGGKSAADGDQRRE